MGLVSRLGGVHPPARKAILGYRCAIYDVLVDENLKPLEASHWKSLLEGSANKTEFVADSVQPGGEADCDDLVSWSYIGVRTAVAKPWCYSHDSLP